MRQAQPSWFRGARVLCLIGRGTEVSLSEFALLGRRDRRRMLCSWRQRVAAGIR
jgi:hypothetical protein